MFKIKMAIKAGTINLHVFSQQAKRAASDTLAILMVSVFFTWSSTVAAAGLRASDAAAQDLLVAREQPNIQSSDWKVRSASFDKITRLVRAGCPNTGIVPECATPSAKRAVTSLLRAEIPKREIQPAKAGRIADATSESDGEASAEYLPAVIQTVLELHDSEAIPVLYDPYILESGAMATRALAYFGPTQARHILELYTRKSDKLYHTSVEMTILSMLDQQTVRDSLTLQETREIFLAQSYSRNAGDRMLAVEALSYFKDPAVSSRLTELSLHDMDVSITEIGHEKHFYVREAASMALRRPASDNAILQTRQAAVPPP